MLFRKLQFTDGLTNLKRGYVGFENKHSPGRPVEATAQEKIHELLKTDRKSYLNLNQITPGPVVSEKKSFKGKVNGHRTPDTDHSNSSP